MRRAAPPRRGALALAALALAAAPAAARPPAPPTLLAGSVDNVLPVRVRNVGGGPLEGVRLRLVATPDVVEAVRVAPPVVEAVAPGAEATFEVRFDLRPGAGPVARAALAFEVEAQGASFEPARTEVTFAVAAPPGAAVRVHPLPRGAAPAPPGPPACDLAEGRVFAGEPLVLLLDPGQPPDAGFDWRVEASDGAAAVEGFHVPGRQVDDGLWPAPAGAPLPLARRLPPLAAGTYAVRTRIHAVGAHADADRAWRDAGAFEVLAAPLELLGFVAETAAVGLPAFPGRVDVARAGEGARVVLRAEATCRAGDPPAGLLRRAELALELPAALSLAAPREVAVRWAPDGGAPGAAAFGVELLPPRPSAARAPTAAVLAEPTAGRVRLATARAVEDRSRLADAPFEGRALVEVAAGDAARAALGWRLRDGAGTWYLPVRLTWGPCAVTGFAAYGAPGAVVTPPAPVPPAPPVAIDAEGGGRFAVGERADLRARVRGGTPPHAVRWRFAGEDVPGATSRLLVRLVKHGAFDAEVLVVDAVGRTAGAVLPVDVGAAGPDAPTFDLVVEGPARVALGAPARFTVRVRGGRAPLAVRWRAGEATAAGPAADIGFGRVGPHVVEVEVTDAAGERVRATHAVQAVDPDPLRAEARVGDVLVGQAARGAAWAGGGHPPYRFAWTVGGLPLEGPSVDATLVEVGAYPWTLAVTDSGTPPAQVVVRGVVTAHPRPTPQPPPPPPPGPAAATFDPAALFAPLQVEVAGVADGDTVQADVLLQLTAWAVGGFPPYEFTWTDDRGHRLSGASVPARPRPGPWTLTCTARDARGVEASRTLRVNVAGGAAPPPGPSPPAPPPPVPPPPAPGPAPGVRGGRYDVLVGGRVVATVEPGGFGQGDVVRDERDGRRWSYAREGSGGLARTFSFDVTCQAGDGRIYEGELREGGRADRCRVVLVEER